MKRRTFLTRRAHHHHRRSHHTRRHPRYHHSHSRRSKSLKRSRRSLKGGQITTSSFQNIPVSKNTVIANSHGKVYSLQQRENALQRADTAEQPGDIDI